jgi:shikimate dehydrogenase
VKRRFAVIGDPIAQSRSPAMHHAAYAACGFPHSYEAVHTTRAELPARIAELRAGTWDGFNVTLPHKQAVLALVDEVDALAQAVGAANTIVRLRDGRLRAFNTDVPALGAELTALAGNATPSGNYAIVLGSGGAARCAVTACALYTQVSTVIVRARAFETDLTLPVHFAGSLETALARMGRPVRVATEGLAAGAYERTCGAVLQATSAGMLCADNGDAVAKAVTWSALPTDAIAYDLVYNPPRTPFLDAAARAGLRFSNGCGMLARQGALAFEHWFETPAPFEAMLAILVRDEADRGRSPTKEQ